MTYAVYEQMLNSVTEALAAQAFDDVQYEQFELPFAANDNAPIDWLDIPFPKGWEASC